MKKMFTKFVGAAMMLSLAVASISAQAQTAADATVATAATTTSNTDAQAATTTTTDATWTPVRRLWGYSFGDFYYDGHADASQASRGKEAMYNGVPTYRNAFQFRRLYLGYDYDVNEKFTAEVLLASEPNANTGTAAGTGVTASNGDNLVDNKMAFFIKNFDLRYRNIWNGTDLVFGEMSTPGFALNEPGTNGPTSLSEATWGYRSIEKTITDFHKNNSYDVGASLQGTFDPATKNFGYVFMIGNNSTSSLLAASAANTGFYKIFYGDIWGKFLDKKLYLDLYADYAQTAPSATVNGSQSHNILKAFAAYNTKKLSVGVEAYTQSISNGVTDKVTGSNADATVQGFSVWVKGAVYKDKVNFFARFDGYNPDTKFNGDDTYNVNTNYGSYDPTTKEKFYTAGLDFVPAPKIHFMPNVWLTQFQSNYNSTNTSFVANDHTVVYRMTVYYTFGK